MHSDYAVETGEEEPLPSLDEGENILPGPFYSRLQPFTYITAAGVVSTLFEHANDDVVVPADIPEDKFKTPAQIRGPAVVSHDHTWRCTDNAHEYASALADIDDQGDTEC
eukprot:m.1348651 g.1348651  ORF g.1348651 m.1348651 type:complete len:110 (+) comp24915_c1_seq6:2730-3059(+)